LRVGRFSSSSIAADSLRRRTVASTKGGAEDLESGEATMVVPSEGGAEDLEVGEAVAGATGAW
jgi:hypothetical protein